VFFGRAASLGYVEGRISSLSDIPARGGQTFSRARRRCWFGAIRRYLCVLSDLFWHLKRRRQRIPSSDSRATRSPLHVSSLATPGAISPCQRRCRGSRFGASVSTLRKPFRDCPDWGFSSRPHDGGFAVRPRIAHLPRRLAARHPITRRPMPVVAAMAQEGAERFRG